MNQQSIGWVRQVFEQAKGDLFCQECSHNVARLEPEYLKIRQKMTQEEQDILEMYIAACEERSFSLIYPAYKLGLRQK